MESRGGCQFERCVFVRTGSYPDYESPGPEGRADHQQRVDFGDRSQPNAAPYTATKHAISGLTKSIALDGRAHNIACSQIDIGNAATELSAPMAAGIRQPDGSIRPEPVMDVAHVADAVLYMANLPLDANVLFMTLKATAMPYEGRG